MVILDLLAPIIFIWKIHCVLNRLYYFFYVTLLVIFRIDFKYAGITKSYLPYTIRERLKNNSAVAILGPSQCGKTTLTLEIVKSFKQSFYLDLENPINLAKTGRRVLDEAEEKSQQ